MKTMRMKLHCRNGITGMELWNHILVSIITVQPKWYIIINQSACLNQRGKGEGGEQPYPSIIRVNTVPLF